MKVSFLLALALLFSRLAAAAYEQRCYYDAGRLAPNYILPCYMEGFGLPAYSCCKQGSNCLKQGACWDAITKVTYQYGCTDSTYQDDKCPKKCGLDRGTQSYDLTALAKSLTEYRKIAMGRYGLLRRNKQYAEQYLGEYVTVEYG
ncbi:hypothetical protein CC78DRAFT_172962 [Lojkania enalia]|uniref:ShKT domain-containing protein n=1 Tax=Lojkania enalia TaxID=147567 RepID=A0A9P4KAL8_9PLEO|nr:hypothetical protein CC78DRAFT_172962 [Didymosphaeria enalia]